MSPNRLTPFDASKFQQTSGSNGFFNQFDSEYHLDSRYKLTNDYP